jgi:hypothetical protein
MKIKQKYIILLILLTLTAICLFYYLNRPTIIPEIPLKQAVNYIQSGRVKVISDGIHGGGMWVFDEEIKKWIPVSGERSEIDKAFQECGKKCTEVGHSLN